MKAILSAARSSLFILFPASLLVFCLSSNGYAATWYISPAGNDVTGNGSVGTPWKTLYKATQTVVTTGDIIHVTTGTYIETQQSLLAAGVSIEGDGISSIIKSTVTADFTEILALGSPEGTNGNQHISNLKFDGQGLSTYWAIWVKGRSNVNIYNCTIVDFKDRGVLFSARSELSDNPPAFAYSTGNSFHDNIVNNCAAYNLSTGIYGRGCLNIGGQDGMQIYNNTIIQNKRPEGYNGWPIKYINNGYLKGCKIYNNTLTKIPFGGLYPGETGWDFCIELFNIQGLEIYGNTIQGSIDLNYNTKGSYAYCAWIHDNNMSRATLNTKFESGIIFEFDTETAIVENNTINNVSSGVQFNTRNGTIISDCVISKNTFTNLGHGDGAGTAGGIVMISEGTNNAVITNLTIYKNTITAAPGKEPFFGIDFGSGENGNATGVYIKNNIVQGFPLAWLKGSVPTHMSDVVLTLNHVSANGNDNEPSWPGGDPGNYKYTNKSDDTRIQNGNYFRTNN
ncbi:MAG TPA: right-handed parallel beta-helix repeat-containing protein [Ferruginibacter sp.]|nr:right-handed parallel beta-helix repeat-containing protein [Ferruginibacter sp.]